MHDNCPGSFFPCNTVVAFALQYKGVAYGLADPKPALTHIVLRGCHPWIHESLAETKTHIDV